MADPLDEASYWRELAIEREISGDYVRAIALWEAAIIATQRWRTIKDINPELDWLNDRLCLARSYAGGLSARSHRQA